MCTDDGESLGLSGPLFHCSYTGAIFYKILAAGNNKVRLDGQLQIEGEGCISSLDHALIAYYRLWIAIMLGKCLRLGGVYYFDVLLLVM